MSLRLAALRSVRWTAASTISNLGARFAVTLLAAHLIPPVDLGLYALVNLVLGFAWLFADAGISQAIIAKQGASDGQLSSLYWFNVLFGLTIAGLVGLAAPLVAGIYGQPRLLGMLLLAGLNFAVAPIAQSFQALLQRELRFNELARVDLGANLLGVAGAVLLLAAGFGIYALVLAQLLTAAARSLFLWLCGRDLLRVRLRLRYGEIRGFVHFGLYQVGDRAVNYLNTRLDQLLIGALMGPQTLGYYNMAWLLVVEPVYRINPIITSVAFPVFARKQNDPSALKRGFLVVAKLLTTTNAPLLLGCAAVAPIAVPLLLGERWAPAIPLIELCSLIAVARTINNPVGSLVLAVGRADRSFYWSLVQGGMQLPLYAAGLATLGLIPATWLLCAINIAAVPMVYFWLIRPILGPVAREYATAVLPPIAIALAMAGIVRQIGLASPAPGFAVLVLQIAIGAAIYGALNLIFRRGDVVQLAGLIRARA
ncbi:MAG: lipopolysaccharide exporter [Aliidongia sp.]|nr:lipopolysaccharide exporter [Aliidongia sp.]